MKRAIYLLVFLLPVLVLASGAGAQTPTGASTPLSTSAATPLSTSAATPLSTNHDLSWHVVAAGGAPMASVGAGHAVNGTLGQPAIGPATAPGHAVGLGYWYGLPRESGVRIYLPLVVRGA